MEILDQELKNILNKLLEGQMRLETEVGTLKEGQMRLETEVGTLKEGQTRIETEVSVLKEGQTRIETKVLNNTIKLEDIEKKINIIAEVQTAHKEQNERHSNIIIQEQDDMNTLLTISLKSVSDDVVEVKGDVKELKENFHRVEKVTMQNTYDVAYLKSVN